MLITKLEFEYCDRMPPQEFVPRFASAMTRIPNDMSEHILQWPSVVLSVPEQEDFQKYLTCVCPANVRYGLVCLESVARFLHRSVSCCRPHRLNRKVAFARKGGTELNTVFNVLMAW